MTRKHDIRWLQRFSNFVKALGQLEKFIIKDELNELEEQGLIQAFEFTHELAWNVLKDYLTYQGITGLIGSRDTTREAFQKGLIQDGEGWMEMIKSRNQTSHTYNESVVADIKQKILDCYFKLFVALKEDMEKRQGS